MLSATSDDVVTVRDMTNASEPGDQHQEPYEFLDRYHPRASMPAGDRLLLDPAKVLDNIATAMERLDLDISTEISIEEDVVSFDELASLIQHLMMGPTLAVHVVNTALRIMAARYPAELVNNPLPPEYDLRQLFPLQITDAQHETARTIFNRRTTSTADLTEDDVLDEFERLNHEGQLQVFVTLFYMYGSKIGAMKYRTGIQ